MGVGRLLLILSRQQEHIIGSQYDKCIVESKGISTPAEGGDKTNIHQFTKEKGYMAVTFHYISTFTAKLMLKNCTIYRNDLCYFILVKSVCQMKYYKGLFGFIMTHIRIVLLCSVR